MAKRYEMTPAELDTWNEWVSRYPPPVQLMAAKFPPNRLFKVISTGQRVFARSYNKNGTITVEASAKYNLLPREELIRVKQEELEECDLPGPGEPVGLTEEEE